MKNTLKRIFSLLLCAVMLLSVLPTGAFAASEDSEKTISALAFSTEDTVSGTYKFVVAPADPGSSLPTELTATVTGETDTVSIQITGWDGIDSYTTALTNSTAGTYTFTPNYTLPDGYTLAEGVSAPTAAITLEYGTISLSWAGGYLVAGQESSIEYSISASGTPAGMSAFSVAWTDGSAPDGVTTELDSSSTESAKVTITADATAVAGDISFSLSAYGSTCNTVTTKIYESDKIPSITVQEPESTTVNPGTTLTYTLTGANFEEFSPEVTIIKDAINAQNYNVSWELSGTDNTRTLTVTIPENAETGAYGITISAKDDSTGPNFFPSESLYTFTVEASDGGQTGGDEDSEKIISALHFAEQYTVSYTYTLDNAPSEDTIKLGPPATTTTLNATVDGEAEELEIEITSWDGLDSYVSTVAGTYIFTPEYTLPEGYKLADGACTPTIMITLTDSSSGTITLSWVGGDYLVAGQESSIEFSISASGTSTDLSDLSINWSCGSAPVGVTTEFTAATSSESAKLTIKTDSTAIANSVSLTVSAGGVWSNTIEVKIYESGKTPSITVQEPDRTTVILGSTLTYTITGTNFEQFNPQVNIIYDFDEVDAQEYNVTWELELTGSSNSGTLTVTIPRNAMVGTYIINISATDGLTGPSFSPDEDYIEFSVMAEARLAISVTQLGNDPIHGKASTIEYAITAADGYTLSSPSLVWDDYYNSYYGHDTVQGITAIFSEDGSTLTITTDASTETGYYFFYISDGCIQSDLYRVSVREAITLTQIGDNPIQGKASSVEYSISVAEGVTLDVSSLEMVWESNQPTGVTASFNDDGTVLTLTTDVSTPKGYYYFHITDGNIRSEDLEMGSAERPVKVSVGLYVESAITLTQVGDNPIQSKASSTKYSISVAEGFTLDVSSLELVWTSSTYYVPDEGTIAFGENGVPDGVTIGFSENGTTLTIMTDTSAVTGNYLFYITDGNIQSGTYSFYVESPITLTSEDCPIQGEPSSVTYEITAEEGVSLSGLTLTWDYGTPFEAPSGVTYEFSEDGTTLTLTTSESTLAGYYHFTITNSDGISSDIIGRGLNFVVTSHILVYDAGQALYGVDRTVAYGVASRAVYSIKTDGYFDTFTPDIEWESGSAPSGVTAAFNDDGTNLVLTTSESTPSGSYYFYVTDGGSYKSHRCSLTVYSDYAVEITEPASRTLRGGTTLQLGASLLPENKTNTTIVWSLAEGDEEYASIAAKTGKLTAKAVSEKHKITVIASSADGEATSDSITLTIVPSAVSVAITDSTSGEVLTGTTITLDLGANESRTVKVSVLPDDAQQSFTFKNSSAKTVSVTDNGDGTLTLTPIANGTATLTVTTADGTKKTAKLTVKVDTLPTLNASDENGAIRSSTKDKTTKLYKEAQTEVVGGKSLSFVAVDENGTAINNKYLTWSIDDPQSSYASIKSGKLTTKAVPGARTITVKVSVTGKANSESTLDVKIYPAVTSLNIFSDGTAVTGSTVALDPSSTLTLTAGTNPSDAMSPTVTWKSSNTKIATVAGGVVTPTGTKTGTVTITAKDSVSGKSATVKVYVGVVAQPKIKEKSAPDGYEGTLKSGQKLTLDAGTSNATNTAVKWTVTEGSSYASVSSKGVVTAKTVYGTETITVRATSKDAMAKYDEYTFTIKPKSDTTLSILKDDTNATRKTLTANTGDKVTLTTNTTNTVTWKSSNKKVATVDENGVVTLKKAGTAKITATAGKRTAYVTIKASTLAANITVSVKKNAAAAVASGKSITLVAAVTAAGGGKPTSSKVTWSITEGASYAKISSSGVLTANKNLTEQQTVKVVATSKDGSGVKSEAFEVTLYPIVTGVDILMGTEVVTNRKLSYDLSDVNEISVAAKTFPSSAQSSVTWTSGNKKVATVAADGTITLKAPGTAKITAKAADGSGKSASFTLVVTQAVTGISLAAKSAKGVTITDTGATITGGKSVTIKATVTPTNATNKKVTWSISGATAYASISSSGVLKTSKVTSAKTVIVTCTAKDGSGESATFKVTINP